MARAGVKADFENMPKPVHEDIVPRRKPSRFEIWAWSQVMSFRVGLFGGYVALIYFGISGLIATPPAFDTTAPEGYAGFWAAALVFGAAIATLGSISPHWLFERIETIGAGLLTLTVGSYALVVLWIAYGMGDATRVAGGAGFVALTVPILIRTMWLCSQLLRK